MNVPTELIDNFQPKVTPKFLKYLQTLKKIFYFSSKMHADASQYYSRFQKYYISIPALILTIINAGITQAFVEETTHSSVKIILPVFSGLTSLLIGFQVIMQSSSNVESHDQTSYQYDKLFRKTDYCIRFGHNKLIDLVGNIYKKQKDVIKDEKEVPNWVSKKYKNIDELYKELLDDDTTFNNVSVVVQSVIEPIIDQVDHIENSASMVSLESCCSSSIDNKKASSSKPEQIEVKDEILQEACITAMENNINDAFKNKKKENKIFKYGS